MKPPPIWLGAYSPGGLALPAAQPTKSQMYAPRGVFFNDEWLAVADSGNHRVLLWRGVPQADRAEADVVLGQPDFVSEGPKLLHLPTGVLIHDNRLIVADAWHHRVLVWNEVPTGSGVEPDYAIGQVDLEGHEVNQGAAHPTGSSLYWPYGIGFAGGWFWIADTGNRRVLGWPDVPPAGEAAHVVLGQDSSDANEENRGGAISARSFRWPHAIAGDSRRLFVADAGNHRVLGWTPAPLADCDASMVLGQSSFTSASELPHVPQGPAKLRFPYSLAMDGSRLAVSDTANNRILIWNSVADGGAGAAADQVLGQDHFGSAGENRWKAVTHDSLCWPYSICLHGGRLAVADSGNNRVTLWTLTEAYSKNDSPQEQLQCV